MNVLKLLNVMDKDYVGITSNASEVKAGARDVLVHAIGKVLIDGGCFELFLR